MKISDSLRDYITSCLPNRAAKAAPPSSPRISYSLTNRISAAFHLLSNKLFHRRPPAGRYDHEPRQSASVPAWTFNSSRSSAQSLQIQLLKLSREPIPENVRHLMNAIQTGDLAALSSIQDLQSIVNTPLRSRISCTVEGEALNLRMPSPLELAVHQLTFTASKVENPAGPDGHIGLENNRVQIVKTLANAGGQITHPDAWGLLINKARSQLGEFSPSNAFRIQTDRFLNHLSAMCIFLPEQQHAMAYSAPGTLWNPETVKQLSKEAKTLSSNGGPYPVERLAQIYVSLVQLVAAMKNDMKSIDFYSSWLSDTDKSDRKQRWTEIKLQKERTEATINVLHKRIELILASHPEEMETCESKADCIHAGKSFLL